MAIVIAMIVVAAVANHFGWIDLSNKNGSSGHSGGAMGIGDEVFNPSRYEAQIELDRQTTLPAPAPVPGDGDKGISDNEPGQYHGRMHIDLGEKDPRP